MSESNLSPGNSMPIELFNQALEFHLRGELEAAKKNYEQLLKIYPEHPEVLHMLGVVALQQKDSSRAIGLISRSLVIKPNMPNAFNNLGNAYMEQKEIEKALKCYDCALKIDPYFEDAISNVGNIFYDRHNYDEAIKYYNRTIAINPKHADAHYNRGNIHLHFERNSAAIDDYSRSVVVNPGIVDAYLNRGQAYKKMGNYKAALADFSQVIKMQPDYAEAYYHRAVTYFADNNLTPAVLDDLKIAAQLKPQLDYLLGSLFFNKKMFVDWTDLESLGNELFKMSKYGERVITPFAFISHFDSLQHQLTVSQIWIKAQIKNNHAALALISQPPRQEKIHLGYFSSDFTEHPVSYATAGLFRTHDKSKFKITGFYLGRSRDTVLEKITGLFDEFYNIADFSDIEVAQLARKLKIDIAVDLNGHTSGSRPSIFLNQVAPVQVNYLGFPGTTGTLLMNYIIADEVVIRAESQKYYTEKIAYLDCFMPHDNQLHVSDKKFTRKELGLPEDSFVFCGFNNSFKITPSVWTTWMNILKSVPQSVLWLSQKNDFISDNLIREARSRGIDSKRIIFAPRLNDVGEHLARHQCADLFLDTYPYNAHTTASMALWAGLPVLTKSGESFASRVAASLLTACQMTELITRTDEDYQAKAVELANNPDKLADLKKRLLNHRDKNSLFDTMGYTRKLENLFCQMYQRSHSGLSPEILKL